MFIFEKKLSYLHKNINNIFIRKNVKCDNDKKKMFYLKNFKIDFGATMTRGDNDNEKYGIRKY